MNVGISLIFIPFFAEFSYTAFIILTSYSNLETGEKKKHLIDSKCELIFEALPVGLWLKKKKKRVNSRVCYFILGLLAELAILFLLK